MPIDETKKGSEELGEKSPAAKGSEGNEEMIPVSVVESIREEMKGVKDELESTKEQLALHQANQIYSGSKGQTQESTEDDEFAKMDDDDVLTVGEFKTLLSGFKQEVGGAISEVQMIQSTPDYADVVKNHLPNVIKGNPALVQAIRTSENPHLLAYILAKTDPEYLKKSAGKETNQEIKKILENADKPAAAGSAGAAGGGASQAEAYANMSEEDLEKKITEVKNK